jgi:hypothetical protein
MGGDHRPKISSRTTFIVGLVSTSTVGSMK